MRLYQSSINLTSLELLKEFKPEVGIHVLRSVLVDQPQTFELLSSGITNIKSKILDSGTYTVNNTPKYFNYTVDKYAIHLQKLHLLFNFCFNFDAVHGDEGTEANVENQYYLEQKGFDVIPVIHNLELEVNYYCKNVSRYPLVAIGSTRLKKMNDLVTATMKLYDAGVKVHWFGIGSYRKLIKAPVWSSDCSSFVQWIKNGRLIFFDSETNKEVGLATRPINKNGEPNPDFFRTHKCGEKYEQWVFENFGLSIEDVVYDENKKLMANSFYFTQLEEEVNKIHEQNGYYFDLY